MEKQLIGRGVLAGAIAGLCGFVFARIFAEPIIQQAIDYESGRDEWIDKLDKLYGIKLPPEGPEIFSRTVQSDIGIGAALILFGAAMGALVAVAYSVSIGRTGNIRPRQLALLVPAFMFVGVYLVPFLKYPANPPAIGHTDTIRERGALYLLMVLFSCLFLFLAVYYGQKLKPRFGTWNASLIAALGYAVAIAIVMMILPPLGHLHENVTEYGRHLTETPLPLKNKQGQIVYPGFPADVLAKFRVYSLINQVIIWGGIALVFAPLAERVLDPGAKERRKAELVNA